MSSKIEGTFSKQKNACPEEERIMVNRFFSNDYAEGGAALEGLSIWKNEEYRRLQGTYPVINLSFANVKKQILHP